MEEEAISLIINEIAIPLPPPPAPFPNQDPNFEKQVLSNAIIDSLDSIKLKIALHPELIKFDYPIQPEDHYPQDYIKLIKGISISNAKNISNVDLKNRTKHEIKLESWESIEDLENFNVLVKISNVIWSKDNSRAAAIAIRRLGKFDGTTYLFLFKRDSIQNETKIYKKYVLLKS
ncbi:MAG TPA: hypothetical protein VK916_06270 [Gillisia sp.]|nr:hypothetical protein [Gillisia sp.]